MRNRRPLANSFPPEAFDASGAFETCRVKKGRVLRLKEHLQRLEASLRSLGIPFPEQEEIQRGLQQAAQGVQEGSVRVAVRRGGRPRLFFHERRGVPYSKGQQTRGISVVTASSRQPSVQAIPLQAKRSERLDGILAWVEGGGSPEVLRFGPHGYLTEATASNLFLIKQNRLITPPLWLGVLEGRMRSEILRIAHRLRISFEELPITRHDLFNAEEAFLTNVLMEILPIRQADGRRIGTAVPGPVTRRLMRAVP